MTWRSDPYYTRGDCLRAKHQLPQTRSGRSFPLWALGLVPFKPAVRILDAGAGWGRFVWTLVEAYGLDPRQITAMDQSVGMLSTAAEEALKRGGQLRLCAGDIGALPLASATFDGVLANHVLYHVEDIPAGVQELARVLRPNGWLLATTNSEKIRVTLIDLHQQALEALGLPFTPEGPSPFSMENGDIYLQPFFRQVERYYFEDEMVYTQADDFIALYKTTGRYQNIIKAPDVDDTLKRSLLPTFERLVAGLIYREGSLRAPLLMGAFVCSGPLGRK